MMGSSVRRAQDIADRLDRWMARGEKITADLQDRISAEQQAELAQLAKTPKNADSYQATRWRARLQDRRDALSILEAADKRIQALASEMKELTE